MCALLRRLTHRDAPPFHFRLDYNRAPTRDAIGAARIEEIAAEKEALAGKENAAIQLAAARKVVTVFGSSRPRERDPAYAEARELGWALAAKGFVVCTGGYGGVMEAASCGAKDAGGQTLAVTAKFFNAQANRWVDEEIQVETWQERLFELIRLGSGYVACKGGTGTLVELAVVWEMLNKGVMARKPFVVLGGFWGPILERVREVELGHPSSWSEANQRLVQIAPTAAAAADYLARRLATPQE